MTTSIQSKVDTSGFVTKHLSKAARESLDKIHEFLMDNPKSIFNTGALVGGTVGFLIGVATGTLIGFATAHLTSKIFSCRI